MPVSVSKRIHNQMATPRIVALWRALQPLKSVVSFMNTGAHPDDETTSMLAAMGLRDGITLSFACANRGEGGQNTIGREATHDLGVVRTAEMERAADLLNLRLYWLSEFPEDKIFDFGFSKSGKETLERWGHERTLLRFVEIIREERPDVICPTFLDISGQHGHHRAMTQLASEVFDAAADPDFAGVDLAPWQVKKLYLPSWSGAGDSYDDDFPPPPPTLPLDGNGIEEVTGWSWAQIAQQSRVFHKTQGMGRWVPSGSENIWHLHLLRSVVEGPDKQLQSGLPATLAELANYADAPQLADTLEDAQSTCDAAIAAWPDFDAVSKYASRALALIRHAGNNCPDDARGEVEHRLHLKEQQLSHIIRISLGAEIRAYLDEPILRPGTHTRLHIEANAPQHTATPQLPEGWHMEGNQMHVGPAVDAYNCYPSRYIPGRPAEPNIKLRISAHGVTSETHIALETPPVNLPALSAALTPEQAVINTQSNLRKIPVSVQNVYPAQGAVDLDMPGSWKSTPTDDGFELKAPKNLPQGVYNIGVSVNGEQADKINLFEYDHIDTRMRSIPASMKVCAVDAKLPDVRIGYIGGGNDRVNYWLRALGLDVHDMEPADFTRAQLKKFDTIVVGIFAIRSQPALQAALPEIHQWINDGGHFLTLYHRPWDDWHPATVPPKHLEIGKPSLRWRVTDENAEVTCLLPDHPLLNSPNKITTEDWENWHKERGLYFAKSWDEAYEPLLSMQDPDEDPHKGSLLSAKIGKGRHTHTSLILHHQLEKLVPGAFRLMANLVAND